MIICALLLICRNKLTGLDNHESILYYCLTKIRYVYVRVYIINKIDNTGVMAGGTVRQPTGRLYDYQKERIRACLRAIGLTPCEPEEEFYVGRVNYAKGARLKKYEI